MNSFALHAGSLFDGFTASGPATVYITGDRIVRVDRTGALPSDGSSVIDLGSRSCLLPGLIDSHTHLAFDAGPDPVTSLAATDDTDLLTHMRAAARSALHAGITTIRDLGDRDYLSLALVEELAQHPEQGPEILTSGPPLTTRGGHGHFFGGEVEGPEALRAAVRERHRRGCAVVKIMASGGNLTPGSVPPHASQYSFEDLRAVVDEAHRLGLPVAAHAHGLQAINDALRAGVDSLEHVSFLTPDGVGSDPALLDAIVESGSFVSLTLGWDRRVAVELPKAIAAHLEEILTVFRDLHKLGAKIVIGSDAGIAPDKPHNVLPHGVGDLARLGVPPLDALISVTGMAARLCRMEGRKGQITAGADADLLAVNGNPSQDPAALLDVRAVFRAGVRVR
ncbi:Imidazolonepropionase [Streptosporangium subroseum]|uniref:Imidazolonepropionase n=1 Tax=Streptosporangium subroseum TaxID=106412 RepID=A0A239EDI7_9ACTN|nr:amidohydrolase family protein [Streptosporangium subroseum]SNS42589.1 Imidazolonepropionase [Streptosporangium subroseum]